jgi:hypothetical protein
VHVAELWRYPVEWLRGESLREAELTARGVVGDRLVYTVAPGGRVITARTYRYMPALEAGLDDHGVPTIAGLPWHDPRAVLLIRAATRHEAELVYDDRTVFVSVALDRRVPYANVYLTGIGIPGEEDCAGRVLRLGEALVGVQHVEPGESLECYVIEPGRIQVGDSAEVLDAWTLLTPEAAAG